MLQWRVSMGKLGVVGGVCAAACALLLSARASAEVRLDWQAAEGCPDAATVTSAMHNWLDTMGTPLGAAEVQLEADVDRSPSGYELELELRTRSGARRMHMFSERCEVFAQVIAVQASLLISAEPQSAAAPPEPAFALRAQGLITSSPLPAPAFGLALTGAYLALPLKVELTGGYLFARDLRYDAHPEVGGLLQSGFLSLRPCAAVQLVRLELSGCVGAEAGLIRGQGIGVSSARASTRSWFALVAGAGLNVSLTPAWTAWLGVDLLGGLTRSEFYVAPLGVLHHAPRFGLRGSLGIEMRIP